MAVVRDAPLVVVILGPTATGKSALAIELALRFDGEVVSADSRQVYRYMDIGTAKPTAEQEALVPHHLIDMVDPDEEYNVARYQREAREQIGGILGRGRLPFLVGGSGLYLAAAMGELDLPIVGPDAEFRARLEKEAEERGGEVLHQRLAQVDPITAARLHPNDVRRVIRALEVQHLTGLPLSAFSHRRCRGGTCVRPRGAHRLLPYTTSLGGRCVGQRNAVGFRFLRIGLTAPRELLYHRIEERVERMMEMGLLDEVRGLIANGYHLGLKSMDSLGYKELGGYLEGRMSLEETVQTFKRNTRRFAKRQLTWFRKTPEVCWFDIAQPALSDVVAREIEATPGKA